MIEESCSVVSDGAELSKGKKRGKRIQKKTYLNVNDEIRIVVKDSGELEVQVKTDCSIADLDEDTEDIDDIDESEIKAGWKCFGYYYNWIPCLNRIHDLIIIKRLLRKTNVSLVELKETFRETQKFLKEMFSKNIK